MRQSDFEKVLSAGATLAFYKEIMSRRPDLSMIYRGEIRFQGDIVQMLKAPVAPAQYKPLTINKSRYFYLRCPEILVVLAHTEQLRKKIRPATSKIRIPKKTRFFAGKVEGYVKDSWEFQFIFYWGWA